MAIEPNPIVEVAQIQGNVIAGFKKDHYKLIFASFEDDSLASFRKWLKGIANELSYADAVLHFNAAFSSVRRVTSADPPMTATWVNLGLTGCAVKRIIPVADQPQFDAVFLNGPVDDATLVGEPPVGAVGGPQSWLIGGDAFHPDLLLIVAGDDQQDVMTVCDRYTDALKKLGATPSSVRIRIEDGQTRSAERGHEHFGFKDGISQPGIRGVAGTATGMLITKRWFDNSDPLAASFSAPGQPLCWPGEFVLGYPRKRTGSIDPMDVEVDPASDLIRNGSYLVYRRLRQDVGAFQSEAVRLAALISANPSYGLRTPDFAATCLVGRWPSGAPLIRSPQQDDPKLGADALASNNFSYTAPGVPPKYDPHLNVPPDTFPPAKSDTPGRVCPFISHIRKVNPRNQQTDQGNAVRTLEHRILRRGIPYGPDFDPAVPSSAKGDRGLQFLCYQSSIERGFQFLMNQWVNSEDFPLGGGVDPIIGQNAGADRPVTFVAPDGSQVPAMLNKTFIQTTGAAYLFSPSRKALESYFGS